MNKKQTFLSRLTPELIVTIVIAIVGWAWAVFQHHDAKPTILVGYVENPTTGISVNLNNGAQTQVVDENIGFFRFGDLKPGTHNLRFERPRHNSYSQLVAINGTGEHLIESKISLPASPDSGRRSGPLLRAVSLMHSPDGSDPWAKLYAQLPEVTNYEHLAVGTPVEYGWVYLADVESDPLLASWLTKKKGAIAELNQPTVLRAAPPSENYYASGYTLGEPIGTIDRGQAVALFEVVEIERDGAHGNAIWARVKLPD